MPKIKVAQQIVIKQFFITYTQIDKGWVKKFKIPDQNSFLVQGEPGLFYSTFKITKLSDPDWRGSTFKQVLVNWSDANSEKLIKPSNKTRFTCIINHQ